MAKRSGMQPLDWITLVLVTIGALNWGLVALNFNLVEFLVSFLPAAMAAIAQKVIYGAVGLSGLYSLYFIVKQAAK
jgi:uncharacterized membrane protein YuzA (DUF378 family)